MRASEILLEVGKLQQDNLPPVYSKNGISKQFLRDGGFEDIGNVNGFPGKYYFSDSKKKMYALATSDTLKSIDGHDRDSSMYYPIMYLNFKRDGKETYNSKFPELKKNNILQVDSVSTLSELRGNDVATNAYKVLVDKGYIICTDRWQTDGGENLWKSLARGTASTFDQYKSSSSNISIYLLTDRGWVTRNDDNRDFPKPFSIFNNDGREVKTIDNDVIWNENLASAIHSFLFIGDTGQLNNLFLTGGAQSKIKYKEAKELMTAAAAEARENPNINGRILSDNEGRQTLYDLIKNEDFNRLPKDVVSTLIGTLKTIENIAASNEYQFNDVLEHYIDAGQLDQFVELIDKNDSRNNAISIKTQLNQTVGKFNQFMRPETPLESSDLVPALYKIANKIIREKNSYGQNLLASVNKDFSEVFSNVDQLIQNPGSITSNEVKVNIDNILQVLAFMRMCLAFRDSIKNNSLDASKSLAERIKKIVTSMGINGRNRASQAKLFGELKNMDDEIKSIAPQSSPTAQPLQPTGITLNPRKYDGQGKPSGYSIKPEDTIPPSLVSGDPNKVNKFIEDQSQYHGLVKVFAAVPADQWTSVITNFTKQINNLYIQRQQSFTSAIAKRRAGTAVTWGEAIKIATDLVNGIQDDQVNETSKYLGPTTKVRINKKGMQVPLNKKDFGV